MKPDMLGYLKAKYKSLSMSGDEVLLDCPVCNDKGSLNLWFNIVKNQGVCYKCGTGFSPTYLVRELEGCSLAVALKVIKDHTFAGAYSRTKVANKLRGVIDGSPASVVTQLPEIELPEGFTRAAPVPAYLQKRMSEEDAYVHEVGWCTSGMYRNRVIVPIVQRGRLVSFVARSMTPKCYRCHGEGCELCGRPYRPYLYPKGCKTGRMLFNFDNACRYSHIVLVEGVFDAIRVGHQGMAILGSSLSGHQLSMILSSRASRVTLMFDPDTAGRKAAKQSATLLRPFYSDIREVVLPPKKDPDDFPRPELWKIIREATQVSSVSSAVRHALDASK